MSFIDFKPDISLNTLILSIVIGLVGYILKWAAKALGEICKNLIQTLVRTITKVEVLESRINEVLAMNADVQKLKYDVNLMYARLREIERDEKSR